MEATKGLQMQYDGTDNVWDFIRAAVEYATLDDPAQQPTDSSGGNRSTSTHSGTFTGVSSKPPGLITPASDWGHLLLQQPARYFRLAHTIDLSLSIGRFSEDCRFPLSRLLIMEMRGEGQSNQDSETAEYAGQYGIFGTGNMSLQEAEDMPCGPASILHIPDEAEGSTNLDYGLTDLPMPMFLGGFDLNVEDGESSIFASLLS